MMKIAAEHSNGQTKLTRTSTYPAVDYVPGAPRNMFGGPDGSVRFQWTGEKRPPRKGEWYLSGAKIEAYRAKEDFSMPFHIAHAVQLKRVETVTVVPWKGP